MGNNHLDEVHPTSSIDEPLLSLMRSLFLEGAKRRTRLERPRFARRLADVQEIQA